MGNGSDNSLVGIYQTAVQMADNVSSRRAGANTFFLTLNTSLAALIGILSAVRKPGAGGSVPSFDPFGLVATAVAGLALSVAWVMLIRYYRRLNHAKFTVINALEERLPARPFSDEWAVLSPGRHWEATVVEQVVPVVFIAVYVTLAIRVMAQ